MSAGQMVSAFGSDLTDFAIGVYLYYRLTGQVTPLALTTLSYFLPQVSLGPFSGSIVDRVDRKWIMVAADLVQGLAVLIILSLLAAGALHFWMIYALVAIAGAATSVQATARRATITLLVPKAHLSRASGWQSLSYGLGTMLAPAVAGILLPLIGISHVLALDVLTYVADTLILMVLRFPALAGVVTTVPRSLVAGLVAGWRYVRTSPGLLGLLVVYSLYNLFGMFVTWWLVTPMVLVSTGNTAALGLINAAFSLGMIVGGTGMTVWGGPRRRIHGVLGAMVLTGLFGQAAFGFGRAFVVWALAAFVGAFLIAIEMGSNAAVWQARVPPELQGRVFAVRPAVEQGTIPVGLLLVGPVVDHLFEPAMRGPVGAALAPVLGAGKVEGYVLAFVVFGLPPASAGVVGFSLPFIRGVDAK